MAESQQQIARDMLVTEARNLHAIQKNAKAMMLRVIDRLDSYPEAEARLRARPPACGSTPTRPASSRYSARSAKTRRPSRTARWAPWAARPPC